MGLLPHDSYHWMHVQGNYLRNSTAWMCLRTAPYRSQGRIVPHTGTCIMRVSTEDNRLCNNLLSAGFIRKHRGKRCQLKSAIRKEITARSNLRELPFEQSTRCPARANLRKERTFRAKSRAPQSSTTMGTVRPRSRSHLSPSFSEKGHGFTDPHRNTYGRPGRRNFYGIGTCCKRARARSAIAPLEDRSACCNRGSASRPWPC